ncbi:hypothetical protein COCMIDRAFT_39290 [Bipolaris oryzae ATCC 44560]|uniref:Uncharacterized protein n=1 Tax=Bipolaris oryzae ATCC 44560 TaxID=930090 RepID=W6YYK8_COCMI|nr:uncharacterized protein COCMIDRAFT_39290 [Bipolaris oryzae ATCC 44560]EUC42658.1 hypothetical protein COCMIDRAFT_39290 [Bipolaris oryzae ATCC 44560]
MAQITQSQADVVATTRQPGFVGSQHTRGSSGVIGLPSVIDPSLFDDCFDLNQFTANDSFTNDILNLDNPDWSATNDPDLTANGSDAKQSQYTDLLQNVQSEIGLGISHAPPEESNNIQYTTEPKYDLEDVLNSLELVSTEPYCNAPLGSNAWDPTSWTVPAYDGATPGLSALPSGTQFMPDMSKYPVISQTQQMYPDPSAALYPTQPYQQFSQQQYSRQYLEYPPIPIEHYKAARQMAAQPVKKRKRSAYSTDSEDDAPANRRPREDELVKIIASPDASRKQSMVSEDGSLSQPVGRGVLKAGEKPKKCEDKPWVRINHTTKGETTRTARINQHAEDGHKYKTKKLPYGDWDSTHYTFEYSKNNGMHEFKKRTMSARQIHEYITQYPGDNLRIWIQPVASDSARRYASASHSHCRFEKCPMRKYTGKGTAEVGNYRVAFDEKHKTYGPGVVDPYDCVGYVHLYCMERFLDFAYICQIADVRVDQRVSMEKEPKGHFASAFGPKHHHEAAVAKKFINAARRGRLAETPEFANYPVHEEYARGAPKPHERTLVHALYDMNIKHRAKSQMKQFILQRTIRPGSFTVHRGDMEVKLVDKKIERLPAFKEFLKDGSKKDFDYSAYYDKFHPEIKERIKECMILREQLISEGGDESTSKRSRRPRRNSLEDSEDEIVVPSKKPKKRSRVDDSDSSDSSPPTRKSRSKKPSINFNVSSPLQPQEPPPCRPSSLRQKPRLNYSEPHDTMPSPRTTTNSASASTFSPSSTVPQPALSSHAPSVSTTTPPPAFFPTNEARKESCTALFPVTDADWANFDLAPLDGTESFLTQAQIDALLNAAYRRKSSTLSVGPMGLPTPVTSPQIKKLLGAPSSPLGAQTDAAKLRRASFNAKPVSGCREFRVEDPPVCVAEGRELRRSSRRGKGEKS